MEANIRINKDTKEWYFRLVEREIIEVFLRNSWWIVRFNLLPELGSWRVWIA
jgi:hypothetical protein